MSASVSKVNVGTAIAGLAATAAAAAIFPIVVYALSLAAFGLWHVASEWRYVVGRFGARVVRPLVLVWAIGLLLLVVGRSALVLGIPIPWPRAATEIGILVVMTALVLLLVRPGETRRALSAIAMTAAFGAALVVSPAFALAALAFLHNLTPIGFFAERFRGRDRMRALALSSLVFVVSPAIVYLIACDRFAADLGHAFAARFFGGFGESESHFAAFMPLDFVERPFARGLFAAAAFLQCAHYAATIHVLPRLDEKAQRPRFAPTALLAAISVGLFVYFLGNFAAARTLYGVAAAAHAWIEWPLFAAIPLLLPARARATSLPGVASSAAEAVH